MTDYTLHYWPIPFRGHFIRYVLAHVVEQAGGPGLDVTWRSSIPISSGLDSDTGTFSYSRRNPALTVLARASSFQE